MPASVSSATMTSSRRLVGARLRNQRDFARRALARRGDDERRLAARHDVVHPAHCDSRLAQTSVSTGMQRIAARSSRSPDAKARPPRGRILFAGERTLDVVNQPVAVGRQTERSERANDPEEVGSDHRQRVDRQKHERDAAEEARAVPVGHQLDLPQARRWASFGRHVGPRKLAATQVFVHKPRRVVAVLEGVARVMRNRPGEAIAERAIESLGRIACGVEGEEPAALLRRAPFDLAASGRGRRRRGERPGRPGPWRLRRDGACSASNRDRAAPFRRPRRQASR